MLDQIWNYLAPDFLAPGILFKYVNKTNPNPKKLITLVQLHYQILILNLFEYIELIIYKLTL